MVGVLFQTNAPTPSWAFLVYGEPRPGFYKFRSFHAAFAAWKEAGGGRIPSHLGNGLTRRVSAKGNK